VVISAQIRYEEQCLKRIVFKLLCTERLIDDTRIGKTLSML